MMIRTYYLLTKPGIIFGNLITTVAGFCLASKGHFDPWLFLAVFSGLGLVIASACVFNNYVDRDLDKKMARTKKRPLAMGLITGKHALIFASLIGFLGLAILSLYTNPLSAAIATLGFFIYVILYSLWKTETTYATLVGSISGALPPVIGYTAVANQIDVGALLLFLILVLWQMPHFFSIALFRLDDYKAAEVPVLPVKRGSYTTKVRMVLYITAFIVATILLAVFGYGGIAYLLVSLPLGIAWLALSLKGFDAENDQVWAKQMFRLSLVVITAISILLSINGMR